jgi:hypothetical protein
LFLIAICLTLAALAGAQDRSAPKARKAAQADSTTPPRPLTADESGTQILDSSPPIIQPQWTKPGLTPAPKTQPVQVVDIRARILSLPGANWYMVRYEAGGNPPPRPAPVAASAPASPSGKPAKPSQARTDPPAPQILLPCSLLEQVELLVAGNPPPLLKVSGETTWYHKKSFLLLQEVITDSGDAPAAPSSRPAEAKPTAAAPAPAAAESTPKLLTELAADSPPDANRPPPAGAPGAASRPASGPASHGLEAIDILGMLATERPGKSLGIGAPPPSPPVTVPSVAPQPAGSVLSATSGAMVVDRIVQVYPDGKSGWWAIHFMGDNTLREPPIRLLPCSLLEMAEDYVGGSAQHLKFRVSGETTSYKGRKYMLLRKLLVEKDLGQL